MQNLFLAPASPENLSTLTQGVRWDLIERHLPQHETEELRARLQPEESPRCWAMAASMRWLFDRMRTRDIVLFAVSGTGLFKYRGELAFKTVSRSLGEALPWRFVPSKPWDLIYFLTEFESVRLYKRQVLDRIGYSKKDELAGARPVKDTLMERLMRLHGSIDKFIASLALPTGDRHDLDTPVDASAALHVAEADVEPLIVAPWLTDLLADIHTLRGDPAHRERAHESLVETFFQLLGYVPFKDIKHRQGHMDLSIWNEEKILAVIEVKRDWGLIGDDTKVLSQGYSYAANIGAPWVIVTNGDFYSLYDRTRSLTYKEDFVGSFTLTRLEDNDLELIELMKRANLQNRV